MTHYSYEATIQVGGSGDQTECRIVRIEYDKGLVILRYHVVSKLISVAPNRLLIMYVDHQTSTVLAVWPLLPRRIGIAG